MMELTPRKRAVLEAVVKAYIKTGEPVGSKNLTALLKNAPSSATIRNEMNELCSMGFLDQPHTSAGRIPTSMGYRFYIDSLMDNGTVRDSAKRTIDAALASRSTDSGGVPKLVCGALVSLTGLPALSIYLAGEGATLRAVKTVMLGRRSVALLMITSDGRTGSRVCRLPSDVDEEAMERFTEIVKGRLLYRPLTEFGKAQLQSVAALTGDRVFMLLPLFTELFEMAHGAGRTTAELYGGDRLYGFCDDRSAKITASLIREVDPILRIIGNDEKKFKVIFGSDTDYPELYGKVFATAPCFTAGRYCGRIGVIGSGRMSYDEIIPSIEYAAKAASDCMTQAEKDMED